MIRMAFLGFLVSIISSTTVVSGEQLRIENYYFSRSVLNKISQSIFTRQRDGGRACRGAA